MNRDEDDELHSRLIDAGKSGDLARREFVEQHLTHATGFVRAAALRVVTSHWKLAAHERTALRALHDEDADVREAAAYGLSNYAHGPGGPLRAVLAVVLDEREVDCVRDAAYHAALVLGGVDRARYPWRAAVPGFEANADWALLADQVAGCGEEMPTSLRGRADAARERGLRDRLLATIGSSPLDVLSFVGSTSTIAGGARDDEQYEVSWRRSAIQVLLDHHAALLDALEPIQRESIADLIDAIDFELRRMGADYGRLPEDELPRGLPTTHWWWWPDPKPEFQRWPDMDVLRPEPAPENGALRVPSTMLAELVPRASDEIDAIVARACARVREPVHAVRFEREDLLDLRDVLDTEAPLAALVARALEAHADLLWTPPSAAPSSSPPDSFAAHVLASGGVVFGVMADGNSSSTDLMARVAGELAEYGYVLADSGEIVDSAGVGTGWAWWSEPAAAYADRPWHVERSPCPFLGACLGYIGVRPWYGKPDDEDGLWVALARTARGVIARLDDDRALVTVSLQRRTLDDAVARNGLDDGDALIERDPGPYFDDVVARIHAAAKSAGIGVHTLATSHNPIRRVEWHEHGERILDTPAAQRRRASIEVELWLRVYDVTEPPCFGPLASQRR